jgi:hypothetical protein
MMTWPSVFGGEVFQSIFAKICIFSKVKKLILQQAFKHRLSLWTFSITVNLQIISLISFLKEKSI